MFLCSRFLPLPLSLSLALSLSRHRMYCCKYGLRETPEPNGDSPTGGTAFQVDCFQAHPPAAPNHHSHESGHRRLTDSHSDEEGIRKLAHHIVLVLL